jgi:membrane dipeptidase
VEHIDYIAQRVGVNHVALGSDFDGAEMPDCLKDVTCLPALLQALTSKGYDQMSLGKITYRNWFRIIKATWKD